MNIIIFVGNKFKDFADNNPAVVTIDELVGWLTKPEMHQLPLNARLVPGQGIREADVQRIRTMIGGSKRFDLDDRPVRASRLLTHKCRLQNSIISAPVRLGEDQFEAVMLLDERSEMFSDHQTGQHIQGMALVEATRQMFLAVSEEFFIGFDEPKPYYFVINSINVAFSAFVFPVDATLRYEILEKRLDNRTRMFFKVKVSVMQAGQCATQVLYEFTAFHAERIEHKEREQAALVVSALSAGRQSSAALALAQDGERAFSPA